MKWVICGLLFVLSLPLAWGDDLKELCQKDIEGTYLGTLDSSAVRINLFCLDEGRPVAVVCPHGLKDDPFALDNVSSLGISAIENGKLILANFGIGPDLRPGGSSKSTVAYLKLDLAAIPSGTLSGTYISDSMAHFASVKATKIEKYPKLVSARTDAFARESIAGAYLTNMDTYKFEVTNLVFDVLLDVPVASLAEPKTGFAIHFTDGRKWDDSGVFSVMTAEGNGGEHDDKRLFYLRGRFLDEKNVEFYLISPAKGLQGPFKATR